MSVDLAAAPFFGAQTVLEVLVGAFAWIVVVGITTVISARLPMVAAAGLAMLGCAQVVHALEWRWDGAPYLTFVYAVEVMVRGWLPLLTSVLLAIDAAQRADAHRIAPWPRRDSDEARTQRLL